MRECENCGSDQISRNQSGFAICDECGFQSTVIFFFLKKMEKIRTFFFYINKDFNCYWSCW